MARTAVAAAVAVKDRTGVFVDAGDVPGVDARSGVGTGDVVAEGETLAVDPGVGEARPLVGAAGTAVPAGTEAVAEEVGPIVGVASSPPQELNSSPATDTTTSQKQMRPT